MPQWLTFDLDLSARAVRDQIKRLQRLSFG